MRDSATPIKQNYQDIILILHYGGKSLIKQKLCYSQFLIIMIAICFFELHYFLSRKLLKNVQRLLSKTNKTATYFSGFKVCLITMTAANLLINCSFSVKTDHQVQSRYRAAGSRI